MLQIIIDFGKLELFGLSIPVRVYAYGLMLVFGFISAIVIARYRARRAGLDPDVLTQCGILSLIGGVLGARIAFVIEKWDSQFADSPNVLGEILNITSGGLIYYGGVVLATVMVLVYLRMKRLPAMRYLDILAISVMVGLAFGRVGCTLNGCCYGQPCDEKWPLAMRFPMFSEPLIKLDGSDGPFSAGMNSPSPVYSEHLCKGLVHPDERLVHQFAAGKMMQGQHQVNVQLLHPPRYLHGRLESDQLATMFASVGQAREKFQALAGSGGRINYDLWQKGFRDSDSDRFLRGSECWDEAMYFDTNVDGQLSFDEAWDYLQARRRRLMQKFPNDFSTANEYLQADLITLAQSSRSAPVKPAQILGIANALLLAGLLGWFATYSVRPGRVFALMLIMYPITRFALEVIRSGSGNNLFGGWFTHNQFTSLGLLAVGVILWFILPRQEVRVNAI